MLVSFCHVAAVCDTMKRPSLRARRPSVRAVPGRCGLRLAAEPHRPLLLVNTLQPSGRQGSLGFLLGSLFMILPPAVFVPSTGAGFTPRRGSSVLLRPQPRAATTRRQVPATHQPIKLFVLIAFPAGNPVTWTAPRYPDNYR